MSLPIHVFIKDEVQNICMFCYCGDKYTAKLSLTGDVLEILSPHKESDMIRECECFCYYHGFMDAVFNLSFSLKVGHYYANQSLQNPGCEL